MAKAEEELEKKLGIKFRNPDVTFNSTLPNNAFNMIGYGEQTAVNIQMINSGKTNYSISVISGVLVNPQNTSQVIANVCYDFYYPLDYEWLGSCLTVTPI